MSHYFIENFMYNQKVKIDDLHYKEVQMYYVRFIQNTPLIKTLLSYHTKTLDRIRKWVFKIKIHHGLFFV